MPSQRTERADARWCLEIQVDGPGCREAADRLVAETFEAGALGYQELDTGNRSALTLLVYAAEGQCEPITSAARRVLVEGVSVGRFEPVPEVDWVAQWRGELRAIVVADLLVVRPESVSRPLGSGVHELVIDPGQAFGTGGHASTRLALEALAALLPGREPGFRVLDVGTGTGILALAALRLGAGRAVGFDIDPIAPPEALRWARRNGLAGQFVSFAGSFACLAPGCFEVVVANLLSHEMLPLADNLASRLSRDGRLVLSGLLRSEQPAIEAAFGERGLRLGSARFEVDESGDEWLSLIMERG